MTNRLEIVGGHIEVKIDTVEYFTCVRCNISFRVTTKRRKGGDVQINVTATCACLEIAGAHIWLKRPEEQS